MPLRYSIGNPSANHPKSMFQLSGVHYKGFGIKALGLGSSLNYHNLLLKVLITDPNMDFIGTLQKSRFW